MYEARCIDSVVKYQIVFPRLENESFGATHSHELESTTLG